MRKKKIKIDNNYLKKWEVKNWGLDNFQRPSECNDDLFHDKYLLLILNNVGFPLRLGYDLESKSTLNDSQISSLRQLFEEEIIESNVSNIQDFLMHITQRIGNCSEFEYASKPDYLSSSNLNEFKLLQYFVKLKSCTITAEFFENSQIVEKKIKFDDVIPELLNEFEEILLRVKAELFVSSINYGFNFRYGETLKKYRLNFDSDYFFDRNKSNILLICLNEVLTHLIDINAIKLKSEVKIFVIKTVFLCGGRDFENTDHTFFRACDHPISRQLSPDSVFN